MASGAGRGRRARRAPRRCSRRSRPTSVRCSRGFARGARARGRPGRGVPRAAATPSALAARARRRLGRERVRAALIGRVRIALFVTCIGDTIFPEVGRATVRRARAARARGRLPRGADLLRADAPEQRLPRRRPSSLAGGSSSLRRATRPSSRRRRRASGRCARRSRAWTNVFELSELLVQQLGVEDVGASFPARVAYHPTCHSLRVTRVGDAPLRLLRNVRGLELVELAGRRRVLRLRRHVRAQERRHVERDARRQVRRDRGDGRRRSARRSTARACCRSAAGSRGAARASRADPPRRDPRLDVTELSGRSRAPSSRTRSSARTCAHATETIRDKRARVVARAARLGGAARGRARRSRQDVLAHLDHYLVEFEAAVAGGRRAGALGARRGRGERGRHRGRAGARRDEVVKVKSLTTDEIELNDALADAGIHALETDFAELILQLDGDWSSHILVPAIHRNRTEIRDLFARTIAPGLDVGRPARPRRGVARLPARALPRARASASAARTSAIAETGTICVVESEGNGRMCTTLPPVLVIDPRDREARADVRRPRGLPAAAAALVDRRADEPVHVALDRRHRRRRPAGAARRAARQRPHARARATRSAGRRCTASAAAPASTSARSTRAPAGTRTARSTRGRSARSSRRSSTASRTRASLPFASSLCGACYEVCPVKIDIPRVLLHLRAKAVEVKGGFAEGVAMGLAGWAFRSDAASRWRSGSPRRRRGRSLAQRIAAQAAAPALRAGRGRAT